MEDEHIEAIIARYIKDEDVVSIGSSALGERFIRKLGLALEHENVPINSVSFIPTSMGNAAEAASMGLKIADINELEIDVAIEFADAIDEQYNFIKRNSASLVRDKMIAQSASTLIVIADENAVMKNLLGRVPFEIATFGWKRTVNQLDVYGKAKRREHNGNPSKTETGHYIADVDFDNIFSYDEVEYESKNIPGVLETGIFSGFADKIIVHGKEIKVMSRSEGDKG